MSDHHQYKRIPLVELAARARDHAIFSPSGSGMWAYCAGSLVPNIQEPDSAGIEAATGTVAHGVGELWLKTGVRPSHLVGTVEKIYAKDLDGEEIVFEITIDEEMLYYVEMYVDWCRRLPGSHYVEVKGDFSDLTPIPNQKGTADHAACMPFKMVITDLKFGVGVKVWAKDNTQAILYAYSFFREWDWLYDFRVIVIRICQPRLDHFDEWTITRDELLEWAEWLSERAHDAWRYDAPRTPGEKQCQWCKIKGRCVAFATWIEDMSEGMFDNLDDPITDDQMDATLARLDAGEKYKIKPAPIYELSDAQKAAIYRHRNLIVAWLDDIGKNLYQSLSDGNDVPFFKLVKGRSARSFRSESEALENLEFYGLSIDEIMPRVLKSPAQIELTLINKGMPRKMLPLILSDKLVRRSSGRNTMAGINDSREEVVSGDDDAFDNLDLEI